MPEFYVMEWGHGATDVFADFDEALEDYKDDPESQEAIKEFGFYTEKPPSPEKSMVEYSERALAMLES